MSVERPSKRHRSTRKPAENISRGRYLTSLVRTVRDGLRWVDEYEYEFNSFVKGRWVHRLLLEVCQKEFIAQTPEYYRSAIENGRILINGKPVTVEHVLDHNDRFTHRAVCKENPVSGDPITMIHETDKILVVSKPASIPIHACGGYRVNSLTSILQFERGDSAELLPAHRIDRLTSGLVILGKTPEAARQVSDAIANDSSVEKFYIARVKGKLEDAKTVRGFIKCIDYRIGKFILIPEDDLSGDVKSSETEIEPILYYSDLDESLVKCRPITGRTHQIRLHLQSIGHPISNDICYGGCYQPTHPFAIKQIPSVQHDNSGNLFCGGIFLHAWRYAIPSLGLDLSADIPVWASGFNP